MEGDEKDDILSFWKQHKQSFPLIASIARDILAIPASNTSVERQFSAYTRFNGAYAMLNVFSSIFDELVQILDSKLLTTYSRINDDFLLDICRFLLLFDTVIKALSDDRRPTLHRVLPFKQYLINKCEIDNDDNEDFKQVKCFLGKRLDEKLELTDEHLIAAVLHPNNKHLHKSPHLKERVILLLK
ncbi:unnamed protein product [Rotaria sp. Silwood2]|nr:unnamed protein product [Rotaria sp. Silwood2]